MKEKKAIFINTASQIAGRFLALIFALISVKLLTNYLGPAGTGEFNTISTYVNFFIIVADLGLFSVTVREIAKNPEKEKKIASNVFTIRLITAFIAAGAAAFLVFLTHYDDNIKYGTMMASGYIFFNLLSSVFDMVLQARLKMQFSAVAELASKFVTLIALFSIIRMHESFLWIVFTITLSAILMFITKWLAARKFLVFSPAYNSRTAGWIFALSWPIGIVFIIDNLYFKIDTLMLFAIKGATEVGIYSVAYKVLEATVFAGSYFANSLKPIISKNILSDKKTVANIINKSFLVMLLISLPITAVSIAYSKEIILFLSNSDFISGSRALVVLSFALPLIYLDTLLGEVLIANDERRLLTRVAIFILSFNFISNLIFIPRYSFMGAAGTTLASELALFLINYHYVRKIIPYTINFKKVSQILLISVLTFLISIMIKTFDINFLWLTAGSFLVYAGLIYIFNIVTIKSLREAVKE